MSAPGSLRRRKPIPGGYLPVSRTSAAQISGGSAGPDATEVATRAADAVVVALEHDMSCGMLEIGRPIPAERDLVKRFKTSRTVVREAIATLSNRGMVDCKPRCRPVVSAPGYTAAINAVGGVVARTLSELSGVRNLYQSRVFLERALVREAAIAARKDDIRALREALDDNERAIPDPDEFYATDVAFHGVLYRIPCNPIFPVVHDAFTQWLSPHWGRMPRSPDRNLVRLQGSRRDLPGHRGAGSRCRRTSLDQPPQGCLGICSRHVRRRESVTTGHRASMQERHMRLTKSVPRENESSIALHCGMYDSVLERNGPETARLTVLRPGDAGNRLVRRVQDSMNPRKRRRILAA